MQAKELISSSIISLHPDDDGNRALTLMEELHVNHLPIVRNNFYLGIISEREVLDWNSQDEFLSEHLSSLAAPSISYNQHLFDIVEILEKNSLSVVPVLDEKKQYQGAISNQKLLYTIAKSAAIQNVGGILTLEMNQNDYSMSEIARIIESNNAKILSSYITSRPNSTNMELTVKVNKTDISNIKRDFERFEYTVTASFSKQLSGDDFTQRYESLMRYLNP